MKRREPKTIGEVIEEMVKACGQEDNFEKQRLCYLWEEVVGQSINRYTSRRFVDGKTLHVYITSAALKEELSYLRPTLVAQLNEAAGAEVINSIVIH